MSVLVQPGIGITAALSSRPCRTCRFAVSPPRAFLKHLAVSCGLASLELRRFIRAVGRPARHCVRINPRKAESFDVRRQAAEPVPWHPNAFFVSEQDGSSLPHLLGEVYSQEPTSMLPAIVMARALEGLDSPLVLDLCAAPGSKTTLLTALLAESALIVANEPQDSRRRVLRTNLIRAGATNFVVTKADGRDLHRVAKECFDAVLADVPCSAEGNLRRYPSNLDDWKIDTMGRGRESLANLQMQLVDSAWLALRPGGVLVYSTCTLNSIENEEVCNYILQKGATPLPTQDLAGLCGPCFNEQLRVWPHYFDTEGFFLAAFQKEGKPNVLREQTPWPTLSSARAKELLSAWPELLAFKDRLVQQEKTIVVMPESHRLPAELCNLVEAIGIPVLRPDDLTLTDEAQLLAARRNRSPGPDPAWWLNLSSRLEGNLGSFNAQLDARAEMGDIAGAENVMNGIYQERLCPDLITYTTLIKAYGRESSQLSAQRAVETLTLAHQAGLRLDAAVFATVLYALARARDLKACENLMNSIEFYEVIPDSACFNSVIHAAADKPQRAEYWLNQAEALAEPDVACYAAVLNAYARASLPNEAEAIMARAFKPNLNCFNALLHAFARSANAQKAELCLDQMRQLEVEPDGISFNTLINAYERCGDTRKSGEVLKDMQRSRVQPTARTFVALGSSSERRGDWPRSLNLFNTMLSLRIHAEQRAYAMLLSAYGNAKQRQAASDLFLTIPPKYQKDGLVREAMWRCFGKAAADVFRRMEQQGNNKL